MACVAVEAREVEEGGLTLPLKSVKRGAVKGAVERAVDVGNPLERSGDALAVAKAGLQYRSCTDFGILGPAGRTSGFI
jgi:hypothetical protein